MAYSSIQKFFIILLLGTVILLIRLFWTYISSIVLALLIASAFYPLYSRVKRLLRNRETTASILMSVLIMVILILPVGGFVGTLSNEAFDFYKRSKDWASLTKIQDFIEGDSVWAQRLRKAAEMANIDLNTDHLQELVTSIGTNVGLYLSKQLRSFASNLLNFLLHFFLMILIIYYIFRDGENLKNYISELLPMPVEQQELVVNKFRVMARAVIWGNGLSGVIQGILGGVGFFIFGLGSPIFWGTVIGFMAFLPIIGASVIFVPATLIMLIQGKGGVAFGYLAFNGCYSAIIEYLVKPRLIGKGMRMNPILVFIGILGGIKLFGILGIIYGPLIITIFLTLAELYRLEYKHAMT